MKFHLIALSSLNIFEENQFYGVFAFLGPQPSAPGPIKCISSFDFLPICDIKCSCATLIKYMCEFSVHKHFNEKLLRKTV